MDQATRDAERAAISEIHQVLNRHADDLTIAQIGGILDLVKVTFFMAIMEEKNERK